VGFHHNEANNLGKVYFEYAMVAWDMAGKDAYKPLFMMICLGITTKHGMLMSSSTIGTI
jgi:hypothetical protein